VEKRTQLVSLRVVRVVSTTRMVTVAASGPTHSDGPSRSVEREVVSGAVATSLQADKAAVTARPAIAEPPNRSTANHHEVEHDKSG